MGEYMGSSSERRAKTAILAETLRSTTI